VHNQVASATKAGVRTVWLDDLGVHCKDRARESEQRVGSAGKVANAQAQPRRLGLIGSCLHHLSTSRHVLLCRTCTPIHIFHPYLSSQPPPCTGPTVRNSACAIPGIRPTGNPGWRDRMFANETAAASNLICQPWMKKCIVSSKRLPTRRQSSGLACSVNST
jgi:hypothetical protein